MLFRSLGDEFAVAAVWDIDEALAAAVAQSCGARACADLADLLADDRVEVVAICSPANCHAEQAIAAMRAGKRMVLIEKPLANTAEEARRIGKAARESGTTVLVGAMHLFDPGWQAVRCEAIRIAVDAPLIRSGIVLPYNSRYEPWAFEARPKVESEGQAPPASPTPSAQERALQVLGGGILQLAIHDLPLVRAMLRNPAELTVTAAETFAPFGYALTVCAGEQIIDLFTHVGDHWQARWTLEAEGARESVSIAFPPSFIAAGAARATLVRDGTATIQPQLSGNGYAGEWGAMARVMRGSSAVAVGIPHIDALVADLAFAADILEQSKALVRARSAAA